MNRDQAGSTPRIAVLDPVVANQIAAGEVVERPASVVKELVENALDAGATRIEVAVTDGGRQLIRVRDNGHGMGEQDAILCLQRHATSKIRCAEDLHNIHTLGFRGEAMPSIASVSQMRVVTREEGTEFGHQVVVEGGAVTGFEKVGCPVGTDITVRNLFFNVPARLKFLKTAGTEMEHITGHMTAFALLHHGVTFRLEHNGRQVMSAPACADLRDAVARVFGPDVGREMVSVRLEAGLLRIVGEVGKPSVARRNRSQQWFFVNGRPIRSRALNYALYEAYHTLLTHGRHPVAVINIEIDPGSIDVNVHPAKHEVRFTREWEVSNMVRRAVRNALESSHLLSRDPGVASRQPEPSASPAALQAPAVPRQVDAAPVAGGDTQPSLFDLDAAEPVTGGPEEEGLRLPSYCKPLGQINQTYIVCDTHDGMLVIDQHALHERILYEQFAATDAQRRADRQLLAVPLTLHLSPRETQATEHHLDQLAKLGFEMEPFGRDTFLVRAVPALLAHQNHERILRDVIDDLVAHGAPRGYEAQRDLVLRTMACKAAVKAGDALAPEEIEGLLKLMRDSRLPFHCNHGRPTMFTIPVDLLERRFARK
ncbi:MAG: DNA mismatch repair endonuclease MutL [Armatimonadetes bacterium]|nr:DNA mismatch repair endonuclease MutL [Armatimonadota bacterium]